MAFDEQLAVRIRSHLRKPRGLVEKKIFGGLAFLINGNMACGISGRELIVRLDPAETARALKQPHTHAFRPSGRPMKGWILVRPAGLARSAALGRWVRQGLEYARSLPPK